MPALVENLFIVDTDADSGAEDVTGNSIANSIYGNSFANVVSGLDGSDFLYGRAGDDVLLGGAGSDYLVGDQGADRLDGGDGDDYLEGDNTYSLGGADVLIGGGGNDRLDGGAFADLLTGGAGRDLFYYQFASSSAGSEVDTITDFETGIDVLSLMMIRSNLVITRTSTGTLIGGVSEGANFLIRSLLDVNGIDISAPTAVTMVGSTLDDILTGGIFGDILVGEAGADTLTGGAGADTLTGGTGADVFRYLATSDSTAAASDTIMDFQSGTDRINLTALNATSISVGRLAGGGSLIFAETPSGGFRVYTPGAAVNATDFLYSGAFGVYVFGSSDADTIVGSVRADPLVGLGGDDIITGGGGADAISGGAGADTFVYTTASDSSQAAGYDNLYDFETGTDKIDLRLLNTTSISILRSENGSSFVFAQSASGDFLTTADRRTVNGTDFLYGNNHGVYLVGSVNADGLTGSNFNDPIYGGAGNDTITGGGGADTLVGEGGADTFTYRAASDSAVSAADIIYDFVTGVDRIDLRSVRTGASDAFGIAYSGTGTFLFVDLGGNGVNDMLILLANTRLVASDILWNTGAIGEEPGVKATGPEVLPVEDGDALFDGLLDLSPMTGRWMLDLEGARGFHGQDWYL